MKNKLQIFISAVFLGYVAWWASFQSVLHDQGVSVQRFSYIYGSIALFGAIVGLFVFRRWGGFKTVLGKALLFFALGLLAQEAGQLIYAYYIFVQKVQIPYPSWGDVAYFGSVLLYIYGAFLLAKAAGVRYALKKTQYKVIAIAVPVVLLSVSYWVFLRGHEYDFGKPLTVFLDFGYPMGQAIYISIALTAYLLSRKMLGGIVKAGILFLILALCTQYVSDFTFIYQSSRGTYISGGTDDLLYLISYFAMATALIKFGDIHRNIEAKAKQPAKDEQEES